MAHSLTSSNPFHLPTTTTRPRRPANRLPRPFLICAKSDPSSDNDSTSSKPNRFFFDFNGKLPTTNSIVPAIVTSSSKSLLFPNQRRKDPNTVFVAGATGQTGVRIALALLRRGFVVRAGVPDLGAAQEVARFAANYKMISSEQTKRLNAVESNFTDTPKTVAKAIGNATKFVITVSGNEDGPTGLVTTADALQLIQAANLAGVTHIVVVYDTGRKTTNNVVDGITSFFSNLFSKSQTLTIEELLGKVVETNLNYTVVKAVLTDAVESEESYGVDVVGEGNVDSTSTTMDGYKVSKSKVAELIAGILSNTSVTENKVVEVSRSASTTSRPVDELFSLIPEDGRRKTYREAIAKAKAEEEALIASQKAQEAAEAAKKLEEEVRKLSEQEAKAASLAKEAKQKAELAGSSLDGILNKAKGLRQDLSWNNLSSKLAPKVELATIRGQAIAQMLPPQAAVVKKAAPPPLRRKVEEKTEKRNVFGGLFKQETIYVDDD